MKRIGLLTILVAASMMIGGSAFAETVTGTVVSVNDNQIVITKDDGSRMTLHMDSQSTRASAINVGDQVRVDYSSMGNNQYHVTTVNLATDATGTQTGDMPAGAQTGASDYGSSQTRTDYSSTETQAQSASAWDDDRTDDALPRTASPLAVIALVGAASLAVGAIVRRKARRAANR